MYYASRARLRQVEEEVWKRATRRIGGVVAVTVCYVRLTQTAIEFGVVQGNGRY